MTKTLFRSRQNRMLTGVCGGIAEYFGIDPSIVRLIYIIGMFVFGTGFLAYLLCTIVIPDAPQ